MPDVRKLARYGGLALIGAGVYLAVTQNSTSSSDGGGSGDGGPPPPPKVRTSLSDWLKQAVAKPRPDVLAGLQAHHWEDVFGQYLKEIWPDEVGAAVSAWSEIEGQWLKVHDPGFWNRADIHAAWFGYPAPAPRPGGGFGDSPGKRSVIGQYLKEHGAPPQYF